MTLIVPCAGTFVFMKRMQGLFEIYAERGWHASGKLRGEEGDPRHKFFTGIWYIKIRLFSGILDVMEMDELSPLPSPKSQSGPNPWARVTLDAVAVRHICKKRKKQHGMCNGA